MASEGVRTGRVEECGSNQRQHARTSDARCLQGACRLRRSPLLRKRELACAHPMRVSTHLVQPWGSGQGKDYNYQTSLRVASAALSRETIANPRSGHPWPQDLALRIAPALMHGMPTWRSTSTQCNGRAPQKREGPWHSGSVHPRCWCRRIPFPSLCAVATSHPRCHSPHGRVFLDIAAQNRPTNRRRAWDLRRATPVYKVADSPHPG
mmetsp:Transcript_52434/g.132542  ORF Transcript_52434/g.132542 Transcript_52434/m.132542 type:complete len:208 (+) Transcript_52434:510-1133(+)